MPALPYLGLGYIGLPTAAMFAEPGFTVTRIDPDGRKIDALKRGESYIPDVPTELVARLVADGLLQVTTDFAAIKVTDVVSICVPTQLRKTDDPDLMFIPDATIRENGDTKLEEVGRRDHIQKYTCSKTA